MKRLTDRRQLATAAFAGIALLFQPEPAFAQQSKESSALEVQLKRLETELHAQRQLIEEQTQRIGAQQAEIDALKTALQLRDIRGTGFAQTQVTPPPGTVALPGAPVGQAPAKPPVDQRAEVQAIPRDLGVLTPKGHLVFDPSVEYTRTSSNRLVFRGIELIPGIQIGLIEATDADRDAIMGNASLRYGITNRLEVEASLPYIYRNDKIEVVQQRDEQIVRNINLKGHGIGDAELNIRYQLNRVRPLKPIWIAGLRIKSATGEGPFEIPFDDFGVATGLATGSGFWGIEPGISFLLPSDPVVIYGGLSYFWHMAKDIDREVGDVFIGRVDPGDAITANIGFGFALNPRFSFSLGYRHNYILRTRTEIGDTTQRSDQLHIGQLNFGMSYRLTPKYTMNLGFEFGVTEEAPDVSITLRTPIELINPN
jgi:hypothetical protein